MKLPSPFRSLGHVVTPHGHFGARRPSDLSLPFDHMHEGMDVSASPGEQIFSMLDGLCVVCDPGVGQLCRVIYQAESELALVFCDLGSANVHPGDRVSAGDVVGSVNDHGFVHIALRQPRFGAWLDPGQIVVLNPRSSA